MQQRLLHAHERQHFAWLEKPFMHKVTAILNSHSPHSARFVGGCVRDSLLGIAPVDIDMATTLRPQTVMELLGQNNIKVVPTGLAHGTVTAIDQGAPNVERQIIEITSLRQDVRTDGRHAIISYTDDWGVDALRRDFTMNALYLAPEGVLYDFVDGLTDMKNKKIRFIGDPVQRIKEDYLRILRFFRFSARFGRAIDELGLRAVQQNLDGIDGLSKERIGAEFCKILALPRAAQAIEAMAKIRCMEKIIPHTPRVQSFVMMKKYLPQADSLLGLALLYPEIDKGEVQTALRLSNAESVRLGAALKNRNRVSCLDTEHDERIMLYELGKPHWRDSVALAYGQEHIDHQRYEGLLALADDWVIPVFPISGKDILAEGIMAGAHVSPLLNEVETIWKQKNFPDEKITREILKDIVLTYKENLTRLKK